MRKQRYILASLSCSSAQSAVNTDSVVKFLLENKGRFYNYTFFRGPYMVHVEVESSPSNPEYRALIIV